MDASIITVGISTATILVAVGGSAMAIRSSVKENARRIHELEKSKGQIWPAITDLVREVSELKGTINTFINQSK